MFNENWHDISLISNCNSPPIYECQHNYIKYSVFKYFVSLILYNKIATSNRINLTKSIYLFFRRFPGSDFL